MNKGPLVSVVMPVYNGERFLAKSIDSILRQTHDNFELIIIDDGSTDRTPNILKSYKDPRIKVHGGSHRGVAAARNKAVSFARGDYIAMQDADDISLPQRLEKQVAYLEAHPGLAMVGTNYKIIDEGDRVLNQTNVFTQPNDLKLALVFFNDFGQGTVMFRAKNLQPNPYNEKLKLAEDYDLWTKISKKHKFANLPECLYLWRFHHDSTWISQQENMRVQAYAIRDRQFEYFMEHRSQYNIWSFHPFSTLNFKGYMARKNQVFRDMALLYCYKGLRRRAVPALLLAILASPLDRRAYRQLIITLIRKNEISSLSYDFI